MYYNFLLQQCNHLDPFVVNTERKIANLIWNYTYNVWCSIDQFKTVDLPMLVWISIRPINSPDKFLINETELFSINFQYFSQITHLSNFNILCQGNVDNKCNRLNQMCRKGVRNRMEGGGVIILSPSIFSKIDKI